MSMPKTAYRVSFIERERGLGIRPDGCMYAFDKELLMKTAKAYCHQDHPPGYVPDEYSVIDGDPIIVRVSDSLYDAIEQSNRKVVSTHRNNHEGDLGV